MGLYLTCVAIVVAILVVDVLMRLRRHNARRRHDTHTVERLRDFWENNENWEERHR